MRIKLIIWIGIHLKGRVPLNSSDLIPVDYHVRTAMLEMYRCYTAKPTDTYGTEDHSASDLG